MTSLWSVRKMIFAPVKSFAGVVERSQLSGKVKHVFEVTNETHISNPILKVKILGRKIKFNKLLYDIWNSKLYY